MGGFPETKSGWWFSWNMTGLFFHSVGNLIIPIDELIFFRGVGSTTSQKSLSTFDMTFMQLDNSGGNTWLRKRGSELFLAVLTWDLEF